MATLANFLGYQGTWLVATLAAHAGLPWAGPVAASVYVGATLAASNTRRTDAALLLAAVACGAVLDGAFAASGVLKYAASDPSLPRGGAPVWILMLWCAFALTLTRSLRWLVATPARAAVAGVVGGPLAYAAAARLGAVEFRSPAAVGTVLLAVGWGVALVGLTALSRRLARRDDSQVAEARP